jgi:hypothetical protein
VDGNSALEIAFQNNEDDNAMLLITSGAIISESRCVINFIENVFGRLQNPSRDDLNTLLDLHENPSEIVRFAAFRGTLKLLSSKEGFVVTQASPAFLDYIRDVLDRSFEIISVTTKVIEMKARKLAGCHFFTEKSILTFSTLLRVIFCLTTSISTASCLIICEDLVILLLRKCSNPPLFIFSFLEPRLAGFE